MSSDGCAPATRSATRIAGDRREREAHHRVTGRDDEVAISARPADDRQAVRRARPQAAPPVNHAAFVEAAHASNAGATNRFDAAVVQREVEAAELERPRQPQLSGQRRDDDSRLLQEERHVRVTLGARVV